MKLTDPLKLGKEVEAALDILTSADTLKPLAANQGRVLKGFIDSLNALLTSDDTTLDELQEIVSYIKQNKTDLSDLGISNIAGLVDALADTLDLRASNLAGDLSAGEQDGIRTKIGITEAFTTALKTAYDSAASWVSTNGANVLAHLGLTNNPHAVTKSQVGLGNVPNLSFSGTNTGDQDLSGKEDAFSKNTAFNKNFGTAAGTASQGNDIRILNGQTAFTWGNHAEEGYLKNQDKPFSFTGSTVGSLNVAFTEGNYYGWSQFTPISQTNFNIIGMQLGGYVRIRIKTSTEPTVTYIGSDPSSSIRKIKGAEFIDNTEMELIIECVSSSSGYNRINYFFLTI